MNKEHYTMMNRLTKNYGVTYFQNRGAKVHFNYGIKMIDEELSQQTGEAEEIIDVRYGVIQTDDLVRDLENWETMLVSTIMQRPIKTILQNEEVMAKHQQNNLKSAVRKKQFMIIQLALAALRTPNGSTEANLYENIVAIPHYTQKAMHVLVDKEDEVEVVKENFKRFQQMYQPIWKDTFGSSFSLEGGVFEITHDESTRRYLMSHINDNVYQNITSKILSVRSYDKDEKFFKIALPSEKKQEIITELIKESQ